MRYELIRMKPKRLEEALPHDRNVFRSVAIHGR
jgi:hypothetical protein